jgi:Na+-transporting NADH:ubiquinone oxidoreductase subunit NqrC
MYSEKLTRLFLILLFVLMVFASLVVAGIAQEVKQTKQDKQISQDEIKRNHETIKQIFSNDNKRRTLQQWVFEPINKYTPCYKYTGSEAEQKMIDMDYNEFERRLKSVTLEDVFEARNFIAKNNLGDKFLVDWIKRSIIVDIATAVSADKCKSNQT